MRWYLDTHKYMSEITRKALQIIEKHGVTSQSSATEIDSTEHELADEGVYKNYDGAKGRIRRALFTYFKAYGCLDDNEQLTDLGREFVNNKLSVREISFEYILNYTYFDENNNISYYPVQLLLKFLSMASRIDNNQAYITPFDFQQIEECDALEDINDIFVKKQIKTHNEDQPEINERSIGYDVWSKMLVQAGVFNKDDDHYLRVANQPLANWILSSYEKGFVVKKGKLGAGIMSNIPLVSLDDPHGALDEFQGEGRAVQAFLFEGLNDNLIRKYIFQNRNASYDSMLNKLGLSNSNRGFYKLFTGLEHLAGFSLAGKQDLYVSAIGKIISSIEFTKDEIDLFAEDINLNISEDERNISGENILLYGVPGSGKSWTIEHEICEPGSKVERLVFHPDYTNADFIGQILPVVDDEKQVTYEFVAGPFTTILREAYYHPKTNYILIIEEINRGNAPAIFGEVFQLLDRLVENQEIDGVVYPKGTSEYGITNRDVAKYVYNDSRHKVRIPSNLSIIGTMNTSDQNVFTLDTAFQRRWEMQLIENNFDNVRRSLAEAEILDTGVQWQTFCNVINRLIIGNRSDMASAEDKRLGVYFIHENDVQVDDLAEYRLAIKPTGDFNSLYDEYCYLLKQEVSDKLNEANSERLNQIKKVLRKTRIFPEKVIKYLWDDAFKFNPQALFDLDNKMDNLEKIIHIFVYSSGVDRFNIFKPTVKADLLAGGH